MKPPEEFLMSQYTGISLALLTGLILPALIPWMKTRRQQRDMARLISGILNISYGRKEQDDWDKLSSLRQLWRIISDEYIHDKINESQYRTLNNKISIGYIEILERKLNEIDGTTGLNELKSVITRAFMNKILDEPHYKILNDKILAVEKNFNDTNQEP